MSYLIATLPCGRWRQVAFYVCSADREEAYATVPVEPLHPPRCRGWLGRDGEDRPVPCLVCRPWLAHRVRYGQRVPVEAWSPSTPR